MRIILLFVILFFSIAVKAQSPLPQGLMDYTQRGTFGNGSNHSIESISDKKWFISRYSGISTSFTFLNGGNATVVAAPLGLQLNRRLNNNLFAFGGISAAPAYINFNRSFQSPAVNKAFPNNGLFKSGSFGMYTRAELGLMYVNEARTFSVSGSIGVQRSSYPMFPFQQMNTVRPSHPIPANQ